jgi:hypothetical protein
MLRVRILCLAVAAAMFCGCGKDTSEPVHPSTGSISGHITNLTTGVPLASANVSTVPPTSSTRSDQFGLYALSGVHPGCYTLKVSAFEYNEATREVCVLAGEDTQADVPLTPIGANAPPNLPTDVYPPHQSVGLPTSLTLTWSCTDPDGDSLAFDVYLDKANPPATRLVASSPDTLYHVAGLDPSTTYYWQIVANDSHQAIRAGDIWRFETGAAAHSH